MTKLALPPGGAARLSAFLSGAIAKTRDGDPKLISVGRYPGSLFYEVTHDYHLAYTCNTWTAEALNAAGLPVSSDRVIVASSVLRQTATIPGACALPDGPRSQIELSVYLVDRT